MLIRCFLDVALQFLNAKVKNNLKNIIKKKLLLRCSKYRQYDDMEWYVAMQSIKCSKTLNALVTA